MTGRHLTVSVWMTVVLYRDLPKYNERRRNLWLPDIVHSQPLQRIASNPSLYGVHVELPRTSPLHWCSEVMGEESTDKRRHWTNSLRSLSISNSTASFPSNPSTLFFVRSLAQNCCAFDFWPTVSSVVVVVCNACIVAKRYVVCGQRWYRSIGQ